MIDKPDKKLNDGIYDFYADAELEHFINIRDTRRQSPFPHSPEFWDERAEEWIDELSQDGSGKYGTNERVRHTVEYLLNRGMLNENDAVVDIGCGPGIFTVEFAKHVKQSVGIDYSKRFVDYGNDLVKLRGIRNAEFRCEDFAALDIDDSGLTGAFDLVFTSITPAATGKGRLEKLIRMSRAWCCNVSFVHESDSLAARVSRDVFGEEFRPFRNGLGFYIMSNMLWLSGYYPETYYYTVSHDEALEPEESIAAQYAVVCGRKDPADTERVLKYMKSLGKPVESHSEHIYGSLLWDVRLKDRR